MKRETKIFSAFSIVIIFCLVVMASCKEKKEVQEPLSVWENMNKVINSISKPKFLDKTYNFLDFGGVPDGVTFNTAAFKQVIKTCTDNGGGKIVIPAGKYLTGAIHLENNVNLHLEEGAEILFSTNPKDYYPLVATSYEGVELMNYSPLIYVKNKKNVAITGKGVLNGQASNNNWWKWCGKDTYGYKKGDPMQRDSLNLPRLMDMGQNNVPLNDRIFGDGHYLRPNFIEFYECESVMLEGVKIINAPFWIIHPFKSKNIIVDGVTVESHGPNNDGCDPEYSKNVLIKNCIFNTGDDCIAIKAGRDAEGRRVGIKSENIVVQNCNMIDGHGGVVIGSEMSAGVKNVYVENCKMNSPNLDRAIRLKTNSRRGGVIDGVYVRDLEVGQVKEAVLKLNMHYATYVNQTGEFIPEIKNILLENIKVKNGGYYAILAKGYEQSKINNVTLKNVVIEKVDNAFSIEHLSNLKLIDTYINGSLMQSPKQPN
ncbi:glycoside hydrolase [Polaribacter reichenbachii]|uniref:Glycoside hydrolase n=1 Tax=Polaribacter reichenbachii TaxID=996801 RepID=A0A1B8TVG5_9FLAO|nr:glycoside hydrolase family 28 protein [Polaribacter reichenbachii]APZ45413.1 glycoside hydrolase [Polaribacter reichenbachii]AUC19274.1 glycoside hydrolase [Polaribacter reichenbachii]OBY63570.1 glycoside hydrolase [Polaribacter reichenbachii]